MPCLVGRVARTSLGCRESRGGFFVVLGSCWHRLVDDTNILLRLGPRVVVVVVVVGGPALHPPLWSRGVCVCVCGWVCMEGERGRARPAVAAAVVVAAAAVAAAAAASQSVRPVGVVRGQRRRRRLTAVDFLEANHESNPEC